MSLPRVASWMLEQEARALLTRLDLVKPLILVGPMVPAAALLPAPQLAIERFLISGRRELHRLVNRFLGWLRSRAGRSADPQEAQRRFTTLRLQFLRVLTHFDMFENVVAQRSDAQTGIWLSGLDNIAADALRLRGGYFEPPPIVCYLDRGMGAAIRRARTRLPGGGSNPVAVVKIPRERLVGSGIASSLFHEVGHQAAALLGLVESLRPVLREIAHGSGSDGLTWRLWERWISEIVADVWSVARAGIASTMGLINVVSLPRPFVFRLNPSDPHPPPYVRVKLSAALGQVFYPESGWRNLIELWESYYPIDQLDSDQKRTFRDLERSIPTLVDVLVNHSPAALRGDTLIEALDTDELQPARLRQLLQTWREKPQEMYRTRAIVTFAALGQGRADGKLTPEEESVVIAKLLTHWAVQSTLLVEDTCAYCGGPVTSGEPHLHDHNTIASKEPAHV
jgi:hypothetical protein